MSNKLQIRPAGLRWRTAARGMITPASLASARKMLPSSICASLHYYADTSRRPATFVITTCPRMHLTRPRRARTPRCFVRLEARRARLPWEGAYVLYITVCTCTLALRVA